MAKTDRCVVRNQAYRKGEFSLRERHNERKNESYGNGDIIPERSHLNVHFKECDGTYEQTFNRMVEDGTISLKGLGKDPKVFDELVFDVNTDYFDRGGGYDYAKEFFAEAYKLAVKEVGDENYILSAVVHADERNQAESEQLGRDVFHYHLHVTYVPVVEKKCYYRKNNRNPELAGKLKEVISQVSHSKKWPRQTQLDENGEIKRNRNGKAVLVNSYSLLQDRFYEHMRAAGYSDFERGERGSTRQHLDDLTYKTQQERKRADALTKQADTLDATVQKKVVQSAKLDKQVKVQKNQLTHLDRKLHVSRQNINVYHEIGNMGKKNLFGRMEIAPADWERITDLAREGVVSRASIKDLQEQVNAYRRELKDLQGRLSRLLDETQVFRQIMKSAPERVTRALNEIIEQEKEAAAPVHKPKQNHRRQER